MWIDVHNVRLRFLLTRLTEIAYETSYKQNQHNILVEIILKGIISSEMISYFT